MKKVVKEVVKKTVRKAVKKAAKEVEIKRERKKINWKALVVCFIIVYAVATVGTLITTNKANIDWYNSSKTPLAPPNFVFMIVWNILFFLISLSLYFAWTAAKKKNKRKVALVFGINFVSSILWGVIFFGFRKTDLAFYDLILLWLSILAMIYVTAKISKKSSLLLFPYLLWVSFAGVLNYLIAFA